MEKRQSLVDRWAEEYSNILERVKERGDRTSVGQVLELGGGEGAMVKAIMLVYPGAEITVVDSNPALAALPIYHENGINFVSVEAGKFLKTSGHPFDLITVALGDNLGITLNDVAERLSNNGVLVEWGCTIPGAVNSSVLESFDVGINDVRVWRKHSY